VPNDLYHNNGNGNHWLLAKLVGTASNRSAIGAKVRVQATIWGQSVRQMREVSGTPLAGDLRVHFGLGDATNVETIRVEWPSGQVTEMHNVAAGQILTITEPPGLGVVGKTGEECELQLTAWPGLGWDIHTCTHLHGPGETCGDTNGQWQLLLSGTNNSRTMTVMDTNCVGVSARFYKAVAR
jgi:hypothetical protein